MSKRKVFSIVLLAVVAALMLACTVFFTACGNNQTPGGDDSQEPTEYIVTFVADGKTVGTDTYTEEDKTIAEPAVPAKDGYTGKWEDYILTTGNITVEAKYEPIEYTITFIAEGKEIDTVQYTVEDRNITEPVVPAKADYNGAWENYTLITGDISVEAVYTPVEYSITFKADGEEVDIVKYTVEDKDIIEPAVPLKDGYTGVWEDYTVTRGNIIVNAEYTAIEYTVTFMDGDIVIGSDTYTVEDKEITVPAVPQKTGYTSKWEEYTLTTGNVAIYAEYEAIQYNIIYENTKEVLNQNPEIYTIESAAIQLHELKADGYKFVGWYCDGEKITEIPHGNTGDLTLIAEWDIITYTITYNYDVEKGDYAAGDSNKTQYTVEDEIVLNGRESKTEGYIFIGWEDESTGEIIEKIEKGSFGDKALTAVFEVAMFTVTWKNYDGTILETDANVEYNTLPVYSGETPIRERDTQHTYTFIGWMPAIEKVTEDVTYVAQFEAGTSSVYQIRYDAKGGQNAPSVQTKQQGTSISLSSVVPVNDGHVFLGWYCAYDDKTYDAGEKFSLNVNVTLYAVWGHTCEICNGAGSLQNKITCSSCSGTGSQTETEWIRCSGCNGSGHLSYSKACSACHGFGGRVYCSCSCGNAWWADQTGSRRCSRCGKTVTGQKMTTCSTCSGSGTVKAYETCNSCSGRGGRYIDVKVTCTSCDGEGYTYKKETCWKCDGEKYLKDEVSSYTVILKDGENIFDSVTVVCGDPYKLPIPTKHGYTFVGWFDAPENGVQLTDGNGVSLNIWDEEGNKTLYARWSLNYYTITYDCDEYVDLDGLPTYYTVEDSPFDLPVQIREHYDFCWQIDGEIVTMIDTSLAKNLTIQAVWTLKQYQISYDLEGGTADNPEYYNIETGDFTLTEPTKTGHTFIGWTGANGEVPQKEVTVIAAEGGNLEFIANWQVNQYTITFETNGGSEIAAITQDFGTPVIAPENPIWEGKSFVGWYTDDTWSVEYVFTTMPAENITLYARWNDYEITIISDDITEISIDDDILSPDLYHATAKDTDGNDVPVTVEILGGSQEIAKTVTVRLTAKGLYGVESSKTLRDIRIYGIPTLSYDLEKDYFNLSDTLNAELFGASAEDSFGDMVAVELSVKEQDYVAGDLVTVILSATDITGNVKVVEIPGVKVYGEPIISRDEAIKEIKESDTVDNALFNATAADSFGEPLIVTTEIIEGSQLGGNTITVQSSATDSKGNSNVITYTVRVYGSPVISDASVTSFKVEENITLALLGITAEDSFGQAIEDIKLELTDGEQQAGNVLTYLVTATDHLGNVQTKTISGIRIYGMPTITFNEEKISMSVTDTVGALLFDAVAQDSFGAPLDVDVILESGTLKGGNTVTFRLSATDMLGNIGEVVTQDIKVYSFDTISLTYNKAASIRIRLTSEGEEFFASATDAFGEACSLYLEAADGYELKGGQIIDLYIVAADKCGNTVKSELISGIRVYDMPVLTYFREYDYIQATDSPYSLFYLEDSFGEEVTATITVISGSLDINETIVYRITGTDRAGNVFERDYELVVLAENESILELYHEDVLIGKQRVVIGDEFVLPALDGYHTVWYYDNAAMTDDMGNSLAVWDFDSNGYKLYGVKTICIEYTISYELNGGQDVSLNPLSYTVESKEITLTAPERIGYTFIGWTGTELAEPTLTVVIPVGSLGNREYSANWVANEYTITFDVNGGILEEETLTVTYDAEYTLPETERAGYTFAGWYLKDELVESGIWQRTEDITLTAQWVANEYAITFDVNGGILEEDTLTVTYDAEYTLPEPERVGYTFAGWYLKDEFVESGVWQRTENITLTAKWTANVYTITFNANGGILEEEMLVVTYDSEYTLPKPERIGYTFTGWYLEYELVESGVWQRTDDITLTAQWTANEYAITFNANGGISEEETLVVTYDAEYMLPEPERIGYTFTGWYSEDKLVESGVWQRTEDIALTAQWVANEYTITFNANGGELKENTLVVTYDAEYTLPEPERIGYTFAGWYLEDKLVESGVWQRTENITLTAQWTINEYTISYELNGGQGVPSNPSIYTVESAEITLIAPERIGYTFIGWTGTDLAEPTLTVVISAGGIGDREYSANWTANEYTITYELNGGQEVMSNPLSYTVESKEITLTAPKRIGYTFIGWTGTELAEPTLTVVIPTGSVGNREYSANWTANEYTITFDANGGILEEETLVVTYDAEYTLPNSERVGYAFVGWYSEDELVESGIWQCTDNITLTAQWTINEYTISYEQNGGQDVSSNPLSYTVESAEITLIAPERIGYTFIGWTGTGLDEPTLTVVIPTGSIGDRKYSAHWNANEYTITFDANGGMVEHATQEVTYDAEYTLPEAERVGYTFAGWYLEDGLVESGIWQRTEDITLTAQWTANADTKYTVLHYQQNINNNEYTLYETEYLTGMTDTSVTPKVKSYTGFTSPALQTAIIAADSSMVVSYYYERNIYTLTVISNDGFTGEVQLKYEEAIVDVSSLPDISVFDVQIFMDSAFSEPCTISIMPARDLILYVKWEKVNLASDFDYSIVSNGITIDYYKGTDETVYIPDMIDGVAVTSIGDFAFPGSSVISVVIPDSVKNIENYAFANNYTLTSVVIGNGVTSIGERAFYNCMSLKDVIIGSSVTGIGNNAFENCSSLLGLVLPNSVKSIGDGAFWACEELMDVIIGNSVTSIGNNAFDHCFKLTSITIPLSVTSIGYNAFADCINLTSVVFETSNGWWYTSDSSATSGTNLSSNDLSDPAIAAEYLESTYCKYYWKRS